jgi:hypothetical protein
MMLLLALASFILCRLVIKKLKFDGLKKIRWRFYVLEALVQVIMIGRSAYDIAVTGVEDESYSDRAYLWIMTAFYGLTELIPYGIIVGILWHRFWIDRKVRKQIQQVESDTGGSSIS